MKKKIIYIYTYIHVIIFDVITFVIILDIILFLINLNITPKLCKIEPIINKSHLFELHSSLFCSVHNGYSLYYGQAQNCPQNTLFRILVAEIPIDVSLCEVLSVNKRHWT